MMQLSLKQSAQVARQTACRSSQLNATPRAKLVASKKQVEDRYPTFIIEQASDNSDYSVRISSDDVEQQRSMWAQFIHGPGASLHQFSSDSTSMDTSEDESYLPEES